MRRFEISFLLQEAEESIRFYRQLDRHSKTEMEILQVEMNKLESLLAKMKCTSSESKLRVADFMTPAARKAMLISLMLAATNQLCGCFTMISYTATIFRESGSTLTPNRSAIVVGCIQVCGAYASSVLVDRAGRKVDLKSCQKYSNPTKAACYLFIHSFFSPCRRWQLVSDWLVSAHTCI